MSPALTPNIHMGTHRYKLKTAFFVQNPSEHLELLRSGLFACMLQRMCAMEQFVVFFEMFKRLRQIVYILT